VEVEKVKGEIMNEIVYKGVQSFNGKDIKVLEGGFGESCRVMTANEIAGVHEKETKEINQSIKRLIEKGRIKQGVHFIDLKSVTNSDPLLTKLYESDVKELVAQMYGLKDTTVI
jgi:hypothetical protein